MKAAVILVILLVIITGCSNNTDGNSSIALNEQNNDAITSLHYAEEDLASETSEITSAVINPLIKARLSDDYIISKVKEARQQIYLEAEDEEEALVYVRNSCTIDEEWFERIINVDTAAKLEELEAATIEEARVKLMQIANGYIMENDFDQYRLMAFKDCSQGYRAILEALPDWAGAMLEIEIDMLSFPQE